MFFYGRIYHLVGQQEHNLKLASTYVECSTYLEYLHFYLSLSSCVSDYGCDMDDDDGY